MNDRRMLPLSILYRFVCCLLGLTTVLMRRDLSKDAELLVLRHENAELLVLRHENAVLRGWVEDLDSRVRVLPTAMADVRGLVRVARAKRTGAARVAELPRRPAPRCAHPDTVLAAGARAELGWQVAVFGLIGLVSTAATAVLYALLRSWSPPLMVNLIALVMVTVLNTEANRRLTFSGARSSGRWVHLQGLVVFAMYYALTSGALLGLHAVDAQPSRWLEVAVLLVASVLGTAGRFVLMRSWVFAKRTPLRTDEAGPR
jgi:putative flippase GtrA